MSKVFCSLCEHSTACVCAERAALGDACEQLGPDELRVLRLIAARLEVGRRQYGQLDTTTDRRNWMAESRDEMFDGCVYLALATMKRAGG